MKIDQSFFDRDVLEVAPDLVGKFICRKLPDGTILKLRITETEAYRGEEDLACHASKGKTPRTETMYQEAGIIYIYLIYGMHWMLNIVTEKEGIPQAVLIRAAEQHDGPAKLTTAIKIDKELNGKSIINNPELSIEDDGYIAEIITDCRVGISYAGEFWASRPWRFIDKNYKISSSAKL